MDIPVVQINPGFVILMQRFHNLRLPINRSSNRVGFGGLIDT